VSLPMERPLYSHPIATPIDSRGVRQGSDDFDSSALVSQLYVDREALLQRVLSSLGRQEQIGLRDIVTSAPLEQGLAELVGYLSLARPDLTVVFDEAQREQVGWQSEGVERVAELPRVTFSRNRSEAS
jgi:hypothetical protein